METGSTNEVRTNQITNIFGPGGLVDIMSRQQEPEMESDFCQMEQDQFEMISLMSSSEGGLHNAFILQNKNSDVDDNSNTDQTTSDDQGVSSEVALFSNAILLRIIFNHSTFQDLKTFRQINRLWNFEATTVLRNNFVTFPLTITEYTVRMEPAEIFRSSPYPIVLSEFTKLVQNSLIFPCTNFLLKKNIIITKKEEIKIFFKDNRHIIKSLFVPNVTSTMESTAAIKELLKRSLPHVQVLVFEGNIDFLFASGNQKLKNLKTLIFPWDQMTKLLLSKIFSSAVNLRCIGSSVADNGPAILHGLDLLIEVNAIPLLKVVPILFEDYDTLSLYEKLLQQDLRLEEITRLGLRQSLPSYLYPRVGEILTKLLEKSCKSLKSIHCLSTLSNISNLEIPVLPNVTRFGCNFSIPTIFRPPNSIPVFPIGTGLAQTFPNLREVTFQFLSDEDYGVFRPVGFLQVQQTPVLTVQILQVVNCGRTNFPTAWIQFFSVYFPNVKRAKLPTLQDFHSAGIHLWKLYRLESLDFGIAVNIHTDTYAMIDSAFTGFSCDDVRLLKNNRELRLLGVEIDLMRIRPPIINLKELRFLNIQFVEKGCDDVDRSSDEEREVVLRKQTLRVEGYTVLSHVAEKFGFQMCPKLLNSNIKIAFVDSYGKLYTMKDART